VLKRLPVYLAAVGLALATLSGCGGDRAPIYQQAFGFQCDKHDSKTARTLCGRPAEPGGAKVSRYCYKTIGSTNCFDRPDPEPKNQPLGSSGY
jgi:hypothetical protein